MKKLIFLGLIAIFFASCMNQTSDDKQRQATEQNMMQAVATVGMPDIKNFQELKLAKMLYELRDNQSLKTYTYMKAADGSLSLLCNSVGYGLPYAAQFTNPDKYYMSGTTLPQAEPNGMFMPDQADATWIMAVDPNTGNVVPMFVEDKVIISPFPLRYVREYTAKKEVIEAERARANGVVLKAAKKALDDDDDDEDGDQ